MNTIIQPSDLAALWLRARASFARAREATGGAAEIAALAPLRRGLRREIAGWIARLEHIVRKLLFAEAARMPPEDLKPNRRGSACTTPSPRGEASLAVSRRIDLTPPETWSVRFSLAIPRDLSALPDSQAPGAHCDATAAAPPRPHYANTREDSTFRLARRFEALRRVIANPAPHALRLARIMRRLVRRFPEAPMLFAAAPARTHHFDRDDPRLGVDSYAAAFNGVPAIDSS